MNDKKQRSIHEEAVDAWLMRIQRDKVLARRVAQTNIDNLLWSFNVRRDQAEVYELEDSTSILGYKYIIKFETLTFEVFGQAVYYIHTCHCGHAFRGMCRSFKGMTSRQAILEDIGQVICEHASHTHLDAKPEPEALPEHEVQW